MKHRILNLGIALVVSGSWVTSWAEAFRNLQAVDTNGYSAWTASFPLSLTGVILNDPGEMLDAAPHFIPWNNGAGAFQLGGQFQVIIQAVWPGDRGGVECWMGQNYGNLPWLHSSALSYDNATWKTEVTRVCHDPATGHVFRRGDLVTVTANASLFRGGMQNINEEHSIDSGADFAISLLRPITACPRQRSFRFAPSLAPISDRPAIMTFSTRPAPPAVSIGKACAFGSAV